VANYQAIVRLRPEVRDFIRNRRWVDRGEAIGYGPNTKCDGFSTDSAGFRHSTFKGETLAVADCLKRERYGLVLGSSHLYGFGLAGNENTIPSLLAERFGFPFGNVCMPEASSRNLYSLLNAFTARAEQPPTLVALMSGGDFTSFCFTSISDPVFGSPNLKQIEAALKERGGRAQAERQMPALLAFTSLWTRAIVQFCRTRRIPVLLGNDSTFFEKAQPSAIEIQSGLGVPSNPSQDAQFATHREYFPQFLARREKLAADLNVPLAGPGPTNSLSFVDEFHYDRAGTRALTEDYAVAIERLL
jgi:hypothetical protein